MAVSITTLLPPTRSGRTLFISSSLLAACALLQLGLLCWHLLRSSPKPTEASILRFAETIEPLAPPLDAPYHRDALAAEAVQAAPATSATGAAADAPLAGNFQNGPAIERPTPAPPEHVAIPDLLEQGRLLRQNGDANGALAKLRQAQSADPSNPQITAELGITYEAMQLPDRAFEQWQRLYAMGDSIGALYYLADTKLHSVPAGPSAPGSVAPGGVGTAAGAQELALLKITDIHAEEQQDPAAEKKISLKIVVKNRPGTAIDPKKVKIETYFYDLLDGKDVVQTDAQTGYNWLTKPVDWASDDSEILETTYFRPLAAATPPPGSPGTPADEAARATRHSRRRGGAGEPAAPEAAPPTDPAAGVVRKYLGYTVRLYYDRQLQDVQAAPLRLLQRFPPPLTLPEE